MSELDSQEAVEWLASAQLDPAEEDKADWRFALFAAVLVNLLARPKRPMSPVQFLAELPWSDSYVTPAEQRQRQIKSEQTMIEFEKARRARKAKAN